MNKNFQRRWLKALRTPLDEGGYIKGFFKLARTVNDEHCFCVMGVAADLLAQDGKYEWDAGYGIYSLPQFALASIGMTEGQQNLLASANDRSAQDDQWTYCDHDDDRWEGEIALVEAL